MIHTLNLFAMIVGYISLGLVCLFLLALALWARWEWRSQDLVLNGIRPRIAVRVKETV